MIIKSELKQTMQHRQAIEYIQKLILQERDKLAYTNWYRENTTPQLGNRSSFEELKQKAEEGNFYDQINLAKCYFYGTFTNKDYTQAVNWCEKAVAHDWRDVEYRESPEVKKEQQELAYCILAYCYFEEDSVVKNEDKAIEWLKKADTQGSVLAQMILAECYFHGLGCQVDNVQAVKYLEKASGRNEYVSASPYRVHKIMYYKNSLARRKLGFFYLKEKNYSLAIQCFSEAISSNNYDESGCYIQSGLSDLLPKFINKKLIPIWIELGVCYYHAEEYENALDCFNKLSEEKDGISQLWLAYLTYFKNKPAFERSGPLDFLLNFGVPSSSGSDTHTDVEIEEQNQREENARNVMDAEAKITSYLHNAASSFFVKEDAVYCDKGYKDNFCDSDMINYVFSEEIRSFLEHSKQPPAKVILAFYNRDNEEEFERYLKQASGLQEPTGGKDILADFLLGKYFSEKNSADFAQVYFKKVTEDLSKYVKYDDETISKVLNCTIKEQIRINIASLELKLELENVIHNKEKEMLSFFTHTMRNALATAPESLRQAIHLLGSDVYEKDTKHYQAINKIAALFSTLSLTDCLIDTFKQSISDPQEFKQSWQKDYTGEATPKWVIASALRQSLNRMIFMSGATELRKLLNNPETVLIKATRKSFIEEVLPLNIDSQGVDLFYNWTRNHIPAIEVSITDFEELNFGANQVRFSLLFAITSELVLNTLKYWDGEDSIQISWRLGEQDKFVFLVKNHCKTNASSNLAGTHKGLAFIKRLVELLGQQAQFDCKIEDQLFTAELILNKSLFDGEI